MSDPTPERKAERHEGPKMLSERSFGLIFAAIFLLIALFPLIFGNDIRHWALVVTVVWALPALIYPAVLRPLNVAWSHFGQLMHTLINPILMGLVFFIAVLPTGLLLKLFGKDPMRRKYEPEADTYWLKREDDHTTCSEAKASITKESFNNQF